MIDTVVKIGGSLYRGGDLQAIMEALGEAVKQRPLLVVPGGGPFADQVRQCDTQWDLDDSSAHWMAILAMDQFAHLLASRLPGAKTVTSLEGAQRCLYRGGLPVICCHGLLRSEDLLPHSWALTSDAIAAHLAVRARARALFLIKSVEDPLAQAGPGGKALKGKGKGGTMGAGPPGDATLEKWEAAGVVDPCFAPLVRNSRLGVEIINGRHPHGLVQALTRPGPVPPGGGPRPGDQWNRCGPRRRRRP